MAPATEDIQRTYGASEGPEFQEHGVKASTKIYEGVGVAIEKASGFATPLTGTAASEDFCGYAELQADNSNGANGDIRVKVRQRGLLKRVSVTGVVAGTDHGVTVYMSDDNTFTLTAGTNTPVGRYERFVANGIADVRFFAKSLGTP